MKSKGQKEFEDKRAAESKIFIEYGAKEFGLTEADLETMTKVGLIRHTIPQDTDGWIRLKFLAKEIDILFRTAAMSKAYAKLEEANGEPDPEAVEKVERLSKAFKLYDNTFRMVDTDAIGRLMSCLDGWDATFADFSKEEFQKQVDEDINELISQLEQPEV